MGDLIERQAASDATLKDPVGRVLADRYNLIGFLEGLPSAQPEIIRCKDCKYKDDYINDDGESWCNYIEISVPEDGFCHKGENRDDG